MSKNGIAHLPTKQLRQEAKLALAAQKRAFDGNSRTLYDITQLPTRYVNNNVVDNPNPGGLILGRPWVSFSVMSLFSNDEQGGWYDATDITTLFQDSAGTTPVTAAEQSVGLILDKSGNNNNASQTTTDNRPQYDEWGIAKFLRFDSSDSLTVSFGSALGSNCTVAYSVLNKDPVILTGQTIGTSFTISTETTGFVIINRALTFSETNLLFEYLKEEGTGAYPILVEYVSIKDSAASPAGYFYAQNSTDQGNNTGWKFK